MLHECYPLLEAGWAHTEMFVCSELWEWLLASGNVCDIFGRYPHMYACVRACVTNFEDDSREIRLNHIGIKMYPNTNPWMQRLVLALYTWEGAGGCPVKKASSPEHLAVMWQPLQHNMEIWCPKFKAEVSKWDLLNPQQWGVIGYKIRYHLLYREKNIVNTLRLWKGRLMDFLVSLLI